MNSAELLERTINEIFDIFGGNHVFRNAISSYIKRECIGKEEDVEFCIGRIHGFIHDYYGKKG